ncbi:hypothetical protein H0H81_006962 [Sphagnurus paluster]|uniref:Uncharacterized protein n=1 Tax=Sphagnurus paluster TaxID=117069 RepID=A0A9P7KGU6_9AGAR|nr:hypothetical protein H0H81_006962 [Sphagnurus paluster]
MFSSIASFLPSLHLNGSNNNGSIVQHTTPPLKPTDNPEEDEDEEEAYKQSPPEDEAGAKKAKTKAVHETFIIVRPPPAKSNHPLNLQVQLVPPANRPPRQSYEDSDATNTSASLTRTASNRSDTSSYGSTASFASTASNASTRRTIIPLYNLQAHNVMTNTIVDAGTDAKIAKFQKRGIELIDLALLEPVEVWSERPRAVAVARNSRPVTPDPSTSTAESSVTSLAAGSSPKSAPIQVSSTPTTPTGPSPSLPTKRSNLFGKMFKRKESASQLAIPAPSLASRFSPKSPAKTITPDPAATPTPRSSRHSRNLSAALPPALAGKLRGRSSSPNPNALGLGLLQIPSDNDPNYAGNGSAADLSTPTTAMATTTAEEPKILRPPVLGIQPTLSFSYAAGAVPPEPIPLTSLTKTGRALMYVWFVRKWYKRRADDADGGSLLAMMQSRGSGNGNGGNPAGEGVEVRFEWKRSGSKARVRRDREGNGNGREKSEGLVKGSRDRLRDKEKLSHRLSTISHQSLSTSLSASDEGHRDRNGVPSRVSFVQDDGEDSDPEDSETPWVCTLKIRRTAAGAGGTTGSGFSARSRRVASGASGRSGMMGPEELGVLPSSQAQVVKVKVGTLSPTPHHPKVVAMLKVPFPLPDVEVETMGIVKRPVGPPNARPAPTQWEGLTLTAEEIKDVVCSTAMWLVVREGFGGIGKVSRKGDGWRIRA